MRLPEKKKLAIRTKILDAASVYSEELAGKVFLYVVGDKHFEVAFPVDRFKHLTGTKSSLSAKDFYKKAKKATLTTDQKRNLDIWNCFLPLHRNSSAS